MNRLEMKEERKATNPPNADAELICYLKGLCSLQCLDMIEKIVIKVSRYKGKSNR